MTLNNEISDLYSILYQKETWYNKSSIVKKKLDAIKKLGSIGDSQSIGALVGYLNHEAKEIRTVTIKSVEHLFKQFDTKNTFDTTLRHCEISIEDIQKYIQNYNSIQVSLPLAIASFNKSGYTREESLKKIEELNLSSTLIPFIIFRLSDWVKEVREAAKSNFSQLLQNENFELIIENLDHFMWLKKVNRVDLSNIFDRIMDFLIVENPTKTFSNFPRLSEQNRFQLSKEIFKMPDISGLAVNTFIKDKSYLVRSALAQNVNRLPNAKELSNELANDKSGLVRQKYLESRLKIKTEIADIDLSQYLTDKSATIRNLARFHLKDENINFLEYYIQCLNNSQLTEPAIYGIGDVGHKGNVDLLFEFLDSSNIKLKIGAIRTILKLDATRISDKLINEIDAKNSTIRKLAINHFSNSPNDSVLAKCREIYKSGNENLRFSILPIFGKNCSYKTLPDLILALSDDSEIVLNSAWSYLLNWKNNAVSNYSTSTKFDNERAKKSYELTKFKDELSYAKKKLWEELPYFGRFYKD